MVQIFTNTIHNKSGAAGLLSLALNNIQKRESRT